jgi:two-component system phosphate regulon sensor histidine kinase PhoR
MRYQFSMANQVVESKICGEDVFIKADADAVERVLMNLLSNAIKYSSVNSKTVVQTLLTGEFFGIKVQDEGKGITEDKLNNIFEPFFRIKEEASSLVEGTGLGLTIVKHIMDAHKGKIEVNSTPGNGSIFTLLFPLVSNEKNINN